MSAPHLTGFCRQRWFTYHEQKGSEHLLRLYKSKASPREAWHSSILLLYRHFAGNFVRAQESSRDAEPWGIYSLLLQTSSSSYVCVRVDSILHVAIAGFLVSYDRRRTTAMNVLLDSYWWGADPKNWRLKTRVSVKTSLEKERNRAKTTTYDTTIFNEGSISYFWSRNLELRFFYPRRRIMILWRIL